MDVDSYDEESLGAGSENGEFSEENPNKRKNFVSLKPLKRVKYDEIAAKPKKNDLYKPPTVEELNELKETETLYNNNLVRLQIEELLKEVKIKEKHRTAFKTWFDSFKTVVEDIPEYSALLSQLKSKNFKKQNLTLNIQPPKFKADQDVLLKFSKPEDVSVFGLDKNLSLPGSNLTVNINLTMPRDCFNVKDYLNNRYFIKRYYYLGYIRNFIKEKVEWTHHNDITLLPVIKVSLTEKVFIHIYATPSENYFKPARFLPNVNNVKTQVFGVDPSADNGTVLYNGAFNHDVTLCQNNLFIENSLSGLNNVQEANKLIWVWLTQRELNQGLGAVSEELLLHVISYLVVKKKLNKHMSSYQVVRNFWNFVYESDLSKGISLSEETNLCLYQESSKVIFLDKSGCYNIASFLNQNVYLKLKSECGIAFNLLDKGGVTSFQSLFINKVPIHFQFDLHLQLKTDISKKFLKFMNDIQRTQYIGFDEIFAVEYLGNLLKKALNKRAVAIVPFVRNKIVSFGVNLDPSHAFNILEKGPELNDPKEKEFKEFWGNLASDRRFKDGSVCVAVYFPTETVKDKRGIIRTILDWVLHSKAHLQYDLIYDNFEEVLCSKGVVAPYPLGTNEEGCLSIIGAFDDLAKKIRILELPLAVTGVQGVSDSFNGTEVFPPLAGDYKSIETGVNGDHLVFPEGKLEVPPFIQSLQCVLQLEHSSKWPKDMQALKHMKTAFLLEISKSLKKQNILSTVRPEELEVFYKGFLFHYEIFLPRELAFYKKEVTSNGIVAYNDTPRSREIQNRFEILPKITSALKGLQSQFPSFGPSTALIKRWLRSQLIDDYHFPDIAVNLLNASLYINPSEFKTSNTPQIGFQRFLKFCSEFQWNIQVIPVDFNHEIKNEVTAEIESRLLQSRSAFPNLYLVTIYDNYESVFTKEAPTKEVLRRVKQLASEALKYLGMYMDVKQLFVPNLEGYDLVIELDPAKNPLRHQNIKWDEGKVEISPFKENQHTKIPIVNFNPVQLYLADLRKHYSDYAYFFHDTYGGDVIAVLWIPKALEARDFKVSHISGRYLVNDKLQLNTDALIDDFYVLGKDLVKSIDKK